MTDLERRELRSYISIGLANLALSTSLLLVTGAAIADSTVSGFWRIVALASGLLIGIFFAAGAISMWSDRRCIKALKGWGDDSYTIARFDEAIAKKRSKLEARLQ